VRQVAAEIPLWKFMVDNRLFHTWRLLLFVENRCEPAYTRIVAETIAAARGVSLEEISEPTTETAEKFFGFNRT